MASRSVVLEAPDDACGYLNGIQKAPFGCFDTSKKCAIYYPTSSTAARAAVDATMVPMITPAPQPSIVCCESSRGDCTVQPTACVDTFEDCTGMCSNDPMTLKCTTEAHIYCNRAHFESPLSFRPVEAPDSGLRSTDAPADGWFCGPSAFPIQHTNVPHSKTASMIHVSHSSVSPTATLSVTVTLSKPGVGPSPSVNPSTTLSVTITLSKPGLEPGPSHMPSPPAAIGNEDTTHEEVARGGDDCCLDEPGTSEPCDYDTLRARLQRRQAMGGSASAVLPAAAAGYEVSRGSAIVSTAYIGQTDRAPFVEATRIWNVVTPTAAATSTTKTNDSRIPHSTRKGKKNPLNSQSRIAIGVTVGLFCVFLIACVFQRQYRHRLVSRQQQHSQQHQNGHGLAGPSVHVSRRQERNIRRMNNLASMADHTADHIADQSPPHDPTDYGDMPGQPGPAFGGQSNPAVGVRLGPAFRGQPGPTFDRRQHAFPESGETTDIEEDVQPQSEDSLEM